MDNLALFYTSHLYHQTKVSLPLMRKLRLEELRNLYQSRLRKALKPDWPRSKALSSICMTCPPECPSFSVHSPVWPLEVNTQASQFLLTQEAALNYNPPGRNPFWQKAQISGVSCTLLSGCPSKIKAP